MKAEKRRDFGDVGGKLAASDEDDDRHRASRGSRQSHKASGLQQGKFFTAHYVTLQLKFTIAALTTDKVQRCITTQKIKTKLKYRANNSYSARNACR